MYIFKLSKNYNKSLFQVLIYNLTIIFESFVKYFHEEILVAALFFFFFVIIILSILRGDGNEFWKTKRGFLSTKYSFTKTSLISATTVIVWEIQIHLCGLFLGCLGLRDMKASLRPKFPEIHQISQIQFDIFGLIIFKDF